MIGKTIAHYRVVDLVGEGGMGVVYRAEDQRLGRTVALKFLPPELTRDRDARARFLNEARAASALEHRNVCVIHDISETEDGQLFIIMPYYEGESLRDRIDRDPLPEPEAVEVLTQIATGLAKAHDHGIFHRDLKPGNVLLTADGDVKIVDFGVAKLSDDAGLTRTGAVVGTLAYLSPEQLSGEPIDARAEIWSLGVLLFELLSGDLPFRGRTQASLVTAILQGRPDLERVRRRAGDTPVAVVKRCLEKAPGDRYQHVRALLSDLQTWRRTLGLAQLAEVPAGGQARAPGAEPPTEAYISPAARGTGLPRARSVDEHSLTPRSSRAVFPVVGRDDELELLEGWLAETLAEGSRVAFVRGEAGRGKSTLLRELCRRAEVGERFLTAVGGCNTQAGTGDPYLPFREILAQLSGELGAQESAGRHTRDHIHKVHSLVPHVASEIVNYGPELVGTFLSGHQLLDRARSLTGPGQAWIDSLESLIEARSAPDRPADPDRSELFEQYTRVVQRVAARQPLILVLEDLHWADSGTAALLFHLARTLGTSPVLLLGTYRREEMAMVAGRDRHPLEPVVNELLRSFGDVEIDLDRTDGRHFVDALLDAQPNRLEPSFRTQLFQRTGGLPLFTTELVRELRDEELLVRDEDGRWVLAGEVDWDIVPKRVEAVVAERVGRLSEELLGVLTTASVEGEEFTAEIVARVLDRDERETVRLLSGEASRRFRVVAAAGVRRIGGRRQSLYRFQHSIYQRFLYDTLDEVERSLQHEDVATEIEGLYGERAEEMVAQLAHHYRLAGVTDKAIEYLRRAGLRAARLSAHQEAIRFFLTALGELEGLPRGLERMRLELELQMALAPVQIAVDGFTAASVEATYLRARELCERLPEASDFPVLWGLFAFSSVRGEFDRSLPLARRMLQAAGDPGSMTAVQSDFAVGVSEFFAGHADAAQSHLASALGTRDEDLGRELSLAFSQDSRKSALAYDAWRRWLAADPSALPGAEEALAWAREDPHPFTLSTVLLLTGFVRALNGDLETVASHADEMTELSETYGLFQTVDAELLRRLAIRPEAPEPDQAESLDEALQSYRAHGSVVFVPFVLTQLARCRHALGEGDSSRLLLDEAQSLAEAGGERFWKAEMLRLTGDLALAEGERGAAEASYREAVSLAQEQAATRLQLRSALALARAGFDRAPLDGVLEALAGVSGLPELDEARRLA